MDKDFAVEMSEILDEVSEEVKGAMKTQMLSVAKETAQQLKSTSPRDTGDYARGWKVSKQRGGDYVVHNATRYRLTHLLENGHVIKNKKGEYGRAPAKKHIEPAEQWASEELPRRIMEDLDL